MRLTNKKRSGTLALIACIMLFSVSSLQAHYYSASASSTSVLRFQQKMANKGHPEAQYKLATMYESGTGVEIDIEQAKTWYNKAAYQNFKPAKNRLIYLDIKQSGFKESHNFWLKDLKHDALYGEGEALFLLGQMYSYGTGVKQDLKKAIRILKKAVASNISGSEFELGQAEKAYAEENKRRAIAKDKEKRKLAELAAIQEQKKRSVQQQLLEQKRRQIEQKIIEQQRRQFEETYKDIAQKQESKSQQQIEVKNKNKKEQTTEIIENNVCSGKNRFAATCR